MQYNEVRKKYLPKRIKKLLIAESPPPDDDLQSSRNFYKTDKLYPDDRLFVNTIKALYNEADEQTAKAIETQKEMWLRRFQADGWYMIEALETSLPHEVTKKERQALIQNNMTHLTTRIKKLINPNTEIILIKSNVFEAAARPLREAGMTVLNQELLDYPGHFNQKSYRQKLARLIAKTK